MATKARGDEHRGQDDDEGHGGDVRVVQIENAYFERLKARLSQQSPPVFGKVTHEPDGGDGPAPAGPGFVVYGDDGRPID